ADLYQEAQSYRVLLGAVRCGESDTRCGGREEGDRSHASTECQDAHTERDNDVRRPHRPIYSANQPLPVTPAPERSVGAHPENCSYDESNEDIEDAENETTRFGRHPVV